MRKWTFKKHLSVCLGLWLLLNIMGSYLLPANKAVSFGVIGGFDGPTAYFLSGKLLNFFLQNAVLLLLLAIMLLSYKPLKKYLEKA